MLSVDSLRFPALNDGHQLCAFSFSVGSPCFRDVCTFPQFFGNGILTGTVFRVF
ncbi:MAG: hypothetical protein IKO41_07230 [Lachnospiraceae bacterium]|nr:hypothetical protein [Lachnospiraceae bacterium]